MAQILGYCTRLELPQINIFRTPGFVLSLDSTLQDKVHLGSISARGVNIRFWILFFLQAFFLFLFIIIGAGIKHGVRSLSGIYTFADICRFVGGGCGILAVILGTFGVWKTNKKILFFTVVLNTVAVVMVLAGWAIDAGNVHDLQNRINKQNASNINPGNLPSSKSHAGGSAVCGAFGWIFTVLAFYLLYAFYQEDGGGSSSPSPKSGGDTQMGSYPPQQQSYEDPPQQPQYDQQQQQYGQQYGQPQYDQQQYDQQQQQYTQPPQ